VASAARTASTNALDHAVAPLRQTRVTTSLATMKRPALVQGRRGREERSVHRRGQSWREAQKRHGELRAGGACSAIVVGPGSGEGLGTGEARAQMRFAAQR